MCFTKHYFQNRSIETHVEIPIKGLNTLLCYCFENNLMTNFFFYSQLWTLSMHEQVNFSKKIFKILKSDAKSAPMEF